ncbi:MAG: PAC2 family protein, partial [Candidatus Thalassarchaeum sp.]|nr:PAC2 family protein [Candidatus Thalassarchaeum sp.]
LKQGVVGGITGGMMGESRRRGGDVMAILAESDGTIGGGFPDARAAARIIECLDDLRPAVHLAAGPLLEEAQRIEGEIREMMAVHLNPPADGGDSLGSMYG